MLPRAREVIVFDQKLHRSADIAILQVLFISDFPRRKKNIKIDLTQRSARLKD